MALNLKKSHEALLHCNWELVEEIRQKTESISQIDQEIETILDNVSPAIFNIDSQLNFSPRYSKSANQIFSNVSFAGKNLLEIFFPLDNQMAERNNLGAWLQKLFGPDSAKCWETLKSLQPVKEIAVKIKTESSYESTKYFQIDFLPIMNSITPAPESIVTKIMVIVQDITERKTLESAIKKKDKEHKDHINQMVEILKLDREIFLDYIDECNEHLIEFESKLIQLKEDLNNMDLVNDLFRIMHAIKGNARIFKLEGIETEARHVESIFNMIRKGEKAITRELLEETFKRLDRFHENNQGNAGYL